MEIKYLALTLALGATLASPSLLLAQDDEKSEKEEFEDLRILYMDEKYEKLISKGEKYADDEDTRKDPTPYLYLSKAYFEISQREDMHEKFPPDKAFRDAMKFAGKYRRKDPDGTLFQENDLYFQELKKAAIEEGSGLISDDNFSRAKRFYDGITDFDPNDPGAWLMLGVSQQMMRASTEAKMSFERAGEVLHQRDMTDLNSTERALLLDGVLRYSQLLVDQGRRDSARTTLDLAAPALEGDAEYDALRSKLK